MITWFRKLAQSWVAKILFVLLILSFGIWGIEDVVRNIWRETAVVRLQGGDIEVPEAQMAARRELMRLQRQLGPSFEPDQAIREAVAARAVETLIAERAQRIEAARLGLATPDEQVASYVRAIPSFQMGGQFDRLILDQFLRQNDLTEPMFLQIVRDDLQRMQLIGAVRAGAPAPDTLSRALLRWERERRVAQLVELPLLDAPDPEEPNEAQLARFHANNPDRFSTPELREAGLAVLTPEILLDQVEVTEEEVRAAFEARRAQFGTAERRQIEQVLVPDEAKAREIAAAWTANPDFAAITTAATEAGGNAIELGTLTRAELPVPELAEAAFAATAGAVTAPVRSAFGWHVLRIVAVTAGSEARLEDVRDQLRREIGLERAGDLAFERANKFEDALAGGARVEDAAREFGLTLTTVVLDAEGRDPDGLPVALPVPPDARAETLRALFAAQPGAAPRLQELRQADGFIAIELHEVKPPSLKPLATIEADVRLAYLTDARRRFQEERAGALLAAVRGGQTLEAAAEAAGLRSDRIGPVGRRPDPAATPGQAIPAELLPGLFAARLNEATMAATPAGFAVAQLLEITPPDTAAENDALATARRVIQQQTAEDLETQFAAALRNRAAPRINPTLMQQVVP